jgi:phosphatidylserine decarboxylase
MQYKGTPEHPFNIDEYIVPEGGYQSFNQFFLRELKPGTRPMCSCADDPNIIVSPCDGGIFYLTRGQLEGNKFPLPGKSHDILQLEMALPGYAGSFLGGPLLDTLLWFTDYHHFRAPVSGTVIHQGVYEGSYNYDFDNYNPNDPYAPALPEDSDRVGWYKKLGKHKRYVWIFRTEELGLVAMIAIGFWGVGSIINEVHEGATLKKGDRMGSFGYGGSSIVLAFEPNLDLQFGVVETKDGKSYTSEVSGPDTPTLMQIQQCLGKHTKRLDWLN